MKKVLSMLLIGLMCLSVVSCSQKTDYSGTYTGYSWGGESKGVPIENATSKIETVLTLDSEGLITDAKVLFYKKNGDGKWYARQDTSAQVDVDFNVLPTPAKLESEIRVHADGDSMFSIKTVDKMSFYAAAVSEDKKAAFMIAEPYTRYQFEFKMEDGFDYSTKIKDMTIGNGLLVPTVRLSAKGYTKVKNWDDYSDSNLFSFIHYGRVFTDRGVFEGLGEDSTMREFMERAGVQFEENMPLPTAAKYGFWGIGGWNGNYKTIEEYLVGKNATEMKTLVDWNMDMYKKGVNEDNFFGVDSVTGATKTVQNSVDGIAGATVRMSRESTSYQRALVEAGILTEEEVIKGRF